MTAMLPHSQTALARADAPTCGSKWNSAPGPRLAAISAAVSARSTQSKRTRANLRAGPSHRKRNRKMKINEPLRAHTLWMIMHKLDTSPYAEAREAAKILEPLYGQM